MFANKPGDERQELPVSFSWPCRGETKFKQPMQLGGMATFSSVALYVLASVFMLKLVPERQAAWLEGDPHIIRKTMQACQHATMPYIPLLKIAHALCSMFIYPHYWAEVNRLPLVGVKAFGV